MDLMKRTIEKIPAELNEGAMKGAKTHLDSMLKPLGSFGRLEELMIQLAGIKGEAKPLLTQKAVVMMCADNGVYEESFHSYPQDITRLIAELSGDKGIVGGSVFSRFVGANMVTVDMGVKGELKGEHIIKKKVRYGTANITKGPAMSRDEAIRAIEAGIEVVEDLAEKGLDILAVGEAGICNTTTSAAMLALLSGCPLSAVVGRGSGLDDEKLAQKLEIVEKAILVNNPDKSDPIDILAKVGGLEIAGMVGCYLAAARYSIPVVIDGFISGVAALTAARIASESKKFMIPSHVSAEPGAQVLLKELNLKPYLTLDMRLGEGTGAILTLNIIDCGVRVMKEMGTFADLSE